MILTLANFKAKYHEVATSGHDTVLTECITAAGGIIKELCNQPIEQETVTYEFAGMNTERVSDSLWGLGNVDAKLITYTVPVEFTSLKYRDAITDAFTTISSGVGVFRRDGLYHLYCTSGFGHLEYQAAIKVGFTTDMPQAIITACAELAIELYKDTNYSEGRLGVSSVTVNQASIATTKQFRPVIEKIMPYLNSYRRYTI